MKKVRALIQVAIMLLQVHVYSWGKRISYIAINLFSFIRHTHYLIQRQNDTPKQIK